MQVSNKSMYGFLLFCFIVEVSSSKCIAIENFDSFDVAMSMCNKPAYCSLRNEMGRNEMERNEMEICSLRNGNLWFAK